MQSRATWRRRVGPQSRQETKWLVLLKRFSAVIPALAPGIRPGEPRAGEQLRALGPAQGRRRRELSKASDRGARLRFGVSGRQRR